MFRPMLLWPSSGWIQFIRKAIRIWYVTQQLLVLVYVRGGNLVYTNSVGMCVRMVKNHAYNMCYPVCLWQCNVRTESVHTQWGAVGLCPCLLQRCAIRTSPPAGCTFFWSHQQHCAGVISPEKRGTSKQNWEVLHSQGTRSRKPSEWRPHHLSQYNLWLPHKGQNNPHPPHTTRSPDPNIPYNPRYRTSQHTSKQPAHNNSELHSHSVAPHSVITATNDSE